jgi:predicted HicB family RNase H-like nuclease
MSPLKSAALNIRIDPNLKEALRVAAKRDHRSIANMVEKLIIEHCESVGISIPEQQSFFGSDSSE